MRERIETSGRDARWEFNKATLFSCSNYMAEVCGNLMEMVEVVDDFFKFLGPELKAVTGVSLLWNVQAGQGNRGLEGGCTLWLLVHVRIFCTAHAGGTPLLAPVACVTLMCLECTPAGDTKGIDDVIERVQLIVEPVETVIFDVFDQAHAPQWRALRARFFADNEEVKTATRELIDTSFRKLRSAESAFDLLQVRSTAGCSIGAALATAALLLVVSATCAAVPVPALTMGPLARRD